MAFAEAFAKGAADFDFKDCEVSLAPFPDFKMSWVRSADWLNIEVSDYLAEMPDHLAAELARTVCSKIRGNKDAKYTEDVRAYISEEVPRLHRDDYLKRTRGLIKEGSYIPNHRLIADALDEIRSKGFRVPYDIVFGWDVYRTSDREVRSSAVFRTVSVPVSLDSEGNDWEFTYRLFVALCRIEAGFDNPGIANELIGRWH